MALRTPNPEDLRKIHAEMNQVVHQRFLLSTLAITMFGVVTTSLLPRQGTLSDPNMATFIFAGSSTLLAILLLLFVFSHLLAHMVRVFSAYLQVTEKSGWELDWAAFRGSKRYLGYSKPHASVFVVLGTLAVAYAFVSVWAFNLPPESVTARHVLWAVAVFYFLVVFILGFTKLIDSEDRARTRWNSLKGGAA